MVLLLYLKSNMKFECSFCGKKYTRKTSYTQHHLFCREVRKSKRVLDADMEDNEDPPSVQDMYKVMKNILVKYDRLESEVKRLREIVRKQRKVDISDWLRRHRTFDYIPDFMEYIKTITFNEDEHLQIALREGYATCIMDYFSTWNTSTQHDLPCISFPQKKENAYLYSKESKTWIIMSSYKDFIPVVEILHKKLLELLLIWKEKHKERGEHDFHYFQNVIVEGMKNTVGLTKHKENNYKKIFKAFKEHVEYPLTVISM